MDTFNFCPSSYVPETLPRDVTASAVTMNGWQFNARPTTPYQRKFKLTLHGLRWYLDNLGYYDATTNAPFNARALELFYQAHETWDPFLFYHQHLGPDPLQVRFATPVTVPAALQGSNGLIGGLEIQLVHHNPSY
jgi:hypothetical protein